MSKQKFLLIGALAAIGIGLGVRVTMPILPAWAAAVTRTPPVTATETGEEGQWAQSIFNVARFKPGMCLATATGSGAAGGSETATCNGAAGQVTTVSLTIATVGAKNTLTITNSKVQTGDSCLATLDPLATAAGAAPVVASCNVTANTLNIIVSNLLAVSPAGAVEVSFLVLTQGNPN